MNKHLHNILSYTKGIWKETVRFHKELPKKKRYGLFAVELIVFLFILKSILGGETNDVKETDSIRKVSVASLASLANSEKDLPLVGSVTSVSEATIRAESSGRLNRVYKKLGDQVYAGQVIAEFENSGERAALLQAEGAYEQAKASRDITKLNSTQTGSSLLETKNQALTTIYSAYTLMDDAIRGKTDSAYSDPKFSQAKLLISVPDASLTLSLETRRTSIERMLVAREARNRSLTTNNDLIAELSTVQNEVQMVKIYLDDLFSAYSKALPDSSYSQASLDAGKATTQAARQSIIAGLSSLVSSRTSLSSGITATQVAGSVGSQLEGSLASAEAQVKQALGAYNAALSRLQKTRVVSPITGTINSLSVETGDYISAFTQIAVVSNNGALEVVSSVNEDDARRIVVGAKATINNTTPAVVTRVASAVDPVTKKMEVRLGVTSTSSSLINGQSVRVAINKTTTLSSKQSSAPSVIVIPLSALKLTPQGANVFTLDASSTLVSIKVKEGAILGDQIQILEGLSGEESIVLDARGLKEGMLVEIKE